MMPKSRAWTCRGQVIARTFYFQDEDKEHAVWFLDAITFLNQVREVRDQKAGGFALCRLGSEDPAFGMR